MSEHDQQSPLLAPKGKARASPDDDDIASETTPLLSSSSATPQYDGEHDAPDGDGAASLASQRSNSSAKKRRKGMPWPSIIAMSILAVLATCIMLLAFFLPAAVEEYSKEAAVLEPTNLELAQITSDGVKARIQANFRIDATRVRDPSSRRLGRWATWVVRKLGTDETQLNVYLPEYEEALLGTAVIPPLVIDIQDGKTTAMDFVVELSPGDAEAFLTIANKWLEGKLDKLKVLGKTNIRLRTGIIPLGTHSVIETLVLEASQIPSLPNYNITRINFRDIPPSKGRQGAVGADISLQVHQDFPLSLTVPELGFEVLLPNCAQDDPRIVVADAVTRHITVEPRSDVAINVEALIQRLPKDLVRNCPHTHSSPLDNFLRQYLHGQPPTVYVRGRRLPESKTPGWISDILSEITVPVPFPGRGFDSFVRNFYLTDVNFKLPSPLADPSRPDDNNPKVSGTIKVLAALPEEMSFDLNVTQLRATADVFYKKNKLGELNVDKWQPANSTKLEGKKDHEPLIMIQSRMKDVPLNITDGDVFSEVVQKLLFGGKDVMLDIKANVDGKINTALGNLVLKDVPAEGRVPVKPMPRDTLGSLSPEIGEIKILGTSSSSINLEALVNVSNPTPYTAYIPYLNVHIGKNGSIIGSATAEGLDLTQGNNTNLRMVATLDPSAGGGSRTITKELLSQYLSGYNVTLDVKLHRDSIPTAPLIGEALSHLNITVPAPKLDLPGDEDEKGKFIRDATFHVFSSTATFTLVSPLHYNTIYIDALNATAYYNHTEPVGTIEYDMPFAAPPGASKTPRLPVNWSVGSIGYEAVKNALGGTLKLDAAANVTIRIGNWRETVWYRGRGIGAHIGF